MGPRSSLLRKSLLFVVSQLLTLFGYAFLKEWLHIDMEAKVNSLVRRWTQGAYALTDIELQALLFIVVLAAWTIYWSWPRPPAAASAPPPAPVSEAAPQALRAWRATPQLVATLRSLAHPLSEAHILFFDPRLYLFAERLAAAFDAAGWTLNFNKTPQTQYPRYVGGIQLHGTNRYLVDSVAAALQATGCTIRASIDTTQIGQENPKYERLQQRVNIVVGYEE